MINLMFSVYDVKTKRYGNPFYAATEEEAIRSLVVAARDPQSLLAMFPNDYELYSIGFFDTETCDVTPDERHYLGRLFDFIGDYNNEVQNNSK